VALRPSSSSRTPDHRGAVAALVDAAAALGELDQLIRLADQRRATLGPAVASRRRTGKEAAPSWRGGEMEIGKSGDLENRSPTTDDCDGELSFAVRRAEERASIFIRNERRTSLGLDSSDDSSGK
jgi:hypothetical protein